MTNRGGERLVTTGNDEWYTPAFVIAAARKVLGDIDLDPASCGQANGTVLATMFYTKEQNGLSQPWFGRVWLNPPYGRLASLFTQRLLDDYRTGYVEAGIVLVNANALGAKWGQVLWDYDLVCSPMGRIHFLNPAGKRTSSTHGSLIGYVGPNPQSFKEVFSEFGSIVQRST